MISTILSAIPLSSIFALIIKAVLHFLDKAEADKEMKRDFLKFVQAFDEHRKIPVELNKKWKLMVEEQKKQVEDAIQLEQIPKPFPFSATVPQLGHAMLDGNFLTFFRRSSAGDMVLE